MRVAIVTLAWKWYLSVILVWDLSDYVLTRPRILLLFLLAYY